ncbi:ceramide synthase-like isoform X1 [Pyxicephalus adspersus]|uniref:TLC domain-containing protein n=1 Tax=Pyxicephalus adspersus TaxID=30357 RepID=A0AAV2ZYA2_PYXAD|nr:TPA: hypothetical protein GDO54_014901 [Pyxicephalus adspersus]DBA19018.1 TPA: hypothetical protein GDO54_014901 [Pyxicephalus adspersus]DBA19019.1 TPA: hypothetical protein GDO54_014901 [Pyxicephalus adspersus]
MLGTTTLGLQGSTAFHLYEHWLAPTYTRFAVPYFIYDIYAMYLCYWHKHKVKGHAGGCELFKGYLHKEFLMVLHHVFMVLVCFPVSVLWREGKGDFFLGCMLMAELSTPFVCLGKVLIQIKDGESKDSIYQRHHFYQSFLIFTR